MSSIVIWSALTIISAVFSVIIGIIVSDDIKRAIGRFMTVGGADPAVGLWIAKFEFPSTRSETTEFIEVIRIRKRFGYYIGKIEEDQRNYEKLRTVAHRKPLRLKAERLSDSLVTGTWLHPIELNHSHGSFQLRVDADGNSMKGFWLGASVSRQTIISGTWEFTRA